MLRKKTLSFPHHTLSGKEASGIAKIQPPQIYQELAKSPHEVVSRLERRKVARILYIHGTFAGNDLTGIARNLSRISPLLTRRLQLDQTLKEWSKRGVDTISGSQGNFPEAYVRQVNQFLQAGHSRLQTAPIQASRFAWSGENHHLGRLHGALSLQRTLTQLRCDLQADQRILIFAHSHGGNLIALLTLLSDADSQIKRKLIRHLSASPTDAQGQPTSSNLATLVNSCTELPDIDIVTLGTPLRYRWSLSQQRRLIHVINHQVVFKEDPHRTAFPNLLKPLDLTGLGDIIQQLGIGGSDFPPTILTPSERKQEKKLSKILESSVRRKDYFKKLNLGRRESCDGESILLDYREIEPSEAPKLFGHAVYTLERLIPFHLALASMELN